MKKKNSVLTLLMIVSVLMFAQQGQSVSQIPQTVKNTLTQFYPNASNVTWEQEEGYFIPVFADNNSTTKLLIDLKGTLVHTSVQIQSSALPSTASSYISSHYAGQTVNDAERLTMFNHSTRYEAVVAGKDILFDSNGNFIKFAVGPLKQ